VWVWEALRDRYLTFERVLAFVLMAVYARVLTDTFISLKAAIPLLNPFAWDATFMRWDRTLHLGRDPWQLLQPLASPGVTAVVSFLYNLWIFVLFGVFIWQAWSVNKRLRKQFFLTFGLAWVLLGTVGATALSSAGPCYYGRVTQAAADPYSPLMAYLYGVDQTHPVWALDVQESLWDAYVASTREHVEEVPAPAAYGTSFAEEAGKEMLNGISAMPSMHVAMAVLFALVGWRVSRTLGCALTLFAIAIQVGAVHLGWHYAIDGYVSAVAIVVLWSTVGRLMYRTRSKRRVAAP
jgi:hypothetical protein